METEYSIVETVRVRYPGLFIPALTTLMGLGLLCAQRIELRPTVNTLTASRAAWEMAPTNSADFAASPAVTTPTASVAGFSVLPLSIIAAVIETVRRDELGCLRMGGLYGP
jgi:hypothetical protein